MNIKPLLIAASSLIMSLVMMISSADAHHAVNAQFDVTKIYSFKGVLKKVQMINPHSYLYFVTNDDKGTPVEWSFETATPEAMKRMGISPRDSFKAGETYRLFYSPSRNGAPVGLMSAIVLQDGRLVGTGSTNSVEQVRAILASEEAEKH